METRIGFAETVITGHSGSLHVKATIQHTNDKGTESLVLSIRLPAGDRSLTELQAEIVAKAKLLLEEVDDSIPPGSPEKLDVWSKLAE